uniref:Uncharacterized protein n=1 Tax=Magallana gigas TaxID=29159 RepID=K1QW54_MAGGI
MDTDSFICHSLQSERSCQEVEHADQTHCMHPSVSSPAFVFAQNRANIETAIFL